MAGIDFHVYLMLGPNPAIPIPSPKHPHAATVSYTFPGSKHAVKLTANGHEMLREGFAVYLVPHVPLPVPLPHPLEAGWLVAIIGTSKSSPAFSRGTVLNAGSPLACCVAGSVGFASNCGGFGTILNSTTVVTTPSASDLARGAVNAGLNAFVSGLFGGLLPLPPMLAHYVKFLFDNTVKKWVISPLVKWVSDEARELVDEFL
ncbi:MAG: hypothetical protein R3B72_30545 [Polyangiaceae bacterium]